MRDREKGKPQIQIISCSLNKYEKPAKSSYRQPSNLVFSLYLLGTIRLGGGEEGQFLLGTWGLILYLFHEKSVLPSVERFLLWILDSDQNQKAQAGAAFNDRGFSPPS